VPTRPIPQKTAKKTNSRPAFKLALLLFVVVVFVFGVAPRLHENKNTSGLATAGFNKSQYSINNPGSIWAIVNKGRKLPSDYAPADLVAPNVPLRLTSTDPEMQIRSIAAPALQQMFSEAAKENIHLMISSGYRSYVLQETVYGGYVASQGQQSADSSSAKPGHSEHQTGLAIDIEPADRECEVQVCFADTPEGKWLAANSYKYGFIIRYQKNQENLTGYEYEPWHVRYVGVNLAQQIHQSGQTLEQFFGLPTYTSYQTQPYQLQPGK
jgi:D-alanyl-D-alanine carboxypeptidase